MIRSFALSIVASVLLLSYSSQAHEHHAPHKGTLVEFGEEFAHVELVIDAATGKVSAYVLDGEAEKSVRIAQKNIVIKVPAKEGGPKEAFDVTLTAQASPLSGEKEGDTSEFAGQSDMLKGLTNFDATLLIVTVKGKAFENVKFNFPKGNE